MTQSIKSRCLTCASLCIEHFTLHVQRPESIMAALPFVGTLDSDDEVELVDDETESEDEQEKVNYCRKLNNFQLEIH